MRMFVAIELGEEIKAELRRAQKTLAEFDRVVRWVTPDQMHLTLKFLGEVADARADGICRTTEQVAQASAPFEMVVGGCGCFPPRGSVRVVWVGLDEPSGALKACNERCENLYAPIGFPKENRPFSPHLTLGRVKEDKTGGKLRQAVEAVRMKTRHHRAEELVVFQSTLLPQGAKYTVVSRHRFK